MNNLVARLGKPWNLHRIILNFYWLNFAFVFIADSIAITIKNGLFSSKLGSGLFQDLGVLFAVFLLLELNYRFKRVAVNFFSNVPGQIFAAAMVVLRPHEDLIPLVYFLPLVTSTLTLKAKSILLNLVVSLLSFTLIYTFVPSAHEAADLITQLGAGFDITIFGMILLYFNKVLNRLIRQIEKQSEENQHLLIKTINMDRLNKTDALTECYNHKSFHEYLAELIPQADRELFSLHLALVDIDDFKFVNDHFGHWNGDQILKRIAATIKEHTTGDDYVYRYGGEEFAILFLGKSPEQAHAVAEAIRQQIASVRHLDLNGRHVTVSIGLKTYLPGEGKESLFKATDAALYEAKRTTKNRTVVAL